MLELIAVGLVDLLLAGLASVPLMIVIRRRRLQGAPARLSFVSSEGAVRE
jgi:hypothetical protein